MVGEWEDVKTEKNGSLTPISLMAECIFYTDKAKIRFFHWGLLRKISMSSLKRKNTCLLQETSV